MKFKLGDRVWIKSFKREGEIIGYKVGHDIGSYSWITTYEVMYNNDHYIPHDYYIPQSFFMKSTFFRTNESDLELFKEAVTFEVEDKMTASEIGALMNKTVKEMYSHINDANRYITVTLPEARNCKDNYSYKITSVNPKLLCSHKWEVYDSGWSKYEFCSKCDEKKI